MSGASNFNRSSADDANDPTGFLLIQFGVNLGRESRGVSQNRADGFDVEFLPQSRGGVVTQSVGSPHGNLCSFAGAADAAGIAVFGIPLSGPSFGIGFADSCGLAGSHRRCPFFTLTSTTFGFNHRLADGFQADGAKVDDFRAAEQLRQRSQGPLNCRQF